jgi:serine/threonine protein kinase
VGRFVALKIIRGDSTGVYDNQPNEAELLRYIATANPSHPGHGYMVKILDDFIHVGPNGPHSCIVFEALGQSVLNFQEQIKDHLFPLQMMRTIAKQTLLALDYLHSCCKLIHTGAYNQY